MCLHVSSYMQIPNYERYKGIMSVIGSTNANKNHKFCYTIYTIQNNVEGRDPHSDFHKHQ